MLEIEEWGGVTVVSPPPPRHANSFENKASFHVLGMGTATLHHQTGAPSRQSFPQCSSAEEAITASFLHNIKHLESTLVLKFEPPMLASDLQMLPTDSDWHDPASSSRFPSYLTFVSLSRSMSPRTHRKPERSDCRGTPPLYILKTFDSKEQLNVQTATSQEASKNTKHTFRCLRWILAHSCGEDESPFLLYLQLSLSRKEP